MVQPGERSSRWWPAIDALRGIAVAAVLLYHHDPERFPGGFLGVSLFFTLSGFLITTILLDERSTTGTIGLTRFWARRLRRLAPVGLLGLCLAVAVGAVTHADSQLDSIAGDVRAALLHVVNWRFAAGGVDYADTISVPSPVTHYWSLSIEEQFYAVYPVLALVALRRGPKLLLAVLAAVAAVSLARQLDLPPNRAYLGTDTRALELAIGAVAAVVRTGWQRQRGRHLLDVASIVGLAVLVASWATVHLDDDRLFRGGLALHAVLAAIVVVGAVDGRVVATLGRARPLVTLGQLSYGVYVFHWPLYLLLDAGRTGLDGPALLAVRLVSTICLAAVAYRLVEHPIRRGGALPRWQAPVALATGIAVAAVAGTSLPHVASNDREITLAHGATLVTMPAPPETTVDDAPTTAPPPTDSASPTTTTSLPSSTEPIQPVPEPPPAAPPAVPDHLLVVGDSSAQFIGVGMQEWARAAGKRVDLYYEYACTLLHEGEYLIREGWVYEQTDACAGLIDGAREAATQLNVDAIILFTGNFQVADWRAVPGVPFSSVGDPVVDAQVLAALTDSIAGLAAAGVPVLVADLPVPAWDADAPTPTGTLPGNGPPTINDAGRVAAMNRLTATAVAAVPLARLLPWASILAGSDGVIEPSDRVDGLHVDPAVSESLMRGTLGTAIAQLAHDAAIG